MQGSLASERLYVEFFDKKPLNLLRWGQKVGMLFKSNKKVNVNDLVPTEIHKSNDILNKRIPHHLSIFGDIRLIIMNKMCDFSWYAKFLYHFSFQKFD